LERQYFGEGITIMGDSLYMLTWQSNTGFIYDANSLERLGSFNYGDSREGWGLCNDGTQIYKSDGSAKIWKLNPLTLRETGFIETVTNTSIFNKANELEYVDGKIYANVWRKPSMMIIDAATGVIEGVVNFGGLRDKVTQHPELDVFNGVAYHRERETFFVTGKNWDRLFEVRIIPRD
jgi:glutamine cyclotransferase